MECSYILFSNTTTRARLQLGEDVSFVLVTQMTDIKGRYLPRFLFDSGPEACYYEGSALEGTMSEFY